MIMFDYICLIRAIRSYSGAHIQSIPILQLDLFGLNFARREACR